MALVETSKKDATILLVEDNEDDAFLTLRALRKNAGEPRDIAIARDGAEALYYLLDEESGVAFMPHLILMDINLPKLNGLEVLRQLRGDDRTQFIPVVMLTSSIEERDLARSYAHGANSYVQKPVDTAEFDEIVQRMADYWLGLNEAPSDAVLRSGPVPQVIGPQTPHRGT